MSDPVKNSTRMILIHQKGTGCVTWIRVQQIVAIGIDSEGDTVINTSCGEFTANESLETLLWQLGIEV